MTRGQDEGRVLSSLLPFLLSSCHLYSSRHTFSSRPIFSISIATLSPVFSQSWGVRPMPTPWGVPVRMTSPGSNVNAWEQKEMSSATPKIISLVLLSCTTWPLRMQRNGQVLRIGDFVCGDKAGADGAEGVQALAPHPLAVAHLHFPGAHIVGAGVACHVAQRICLAHPARRLADDHGQFRFVVHLLREFRRPDNFVAGVDHAAGEFGKDQRPGWGGCSWSRGCDPCNSTQSPRSCRGGQPG
jgi:hypothetical protein